MVINKEQGDLFYRLWLPLLSYARKIIYDVIRAHSADPMTDSLKLWDICIF